jgi:hypothetical protein
MPILARPFKDLLSKKFRVRCELLALRLGNLNRAGPRNRQRSTLPMHRVARRAAKCLYRGFVGRDLAEEALLEHGDDGFHL